MEKEDKLKLIEMRKHLAELHDKWQKGVEDGLYGNLNLTDDGHCKSNEGYIGLLYRLDNWFECESDKEKYLAAKPKLSMVEVYSYLFGPSRLHTFETIDEAHKEVMSW